MTEKRKLLRTEASLFSRLRYVYSYAVSFASRPFVFCLNVCVLRACIRSCSHVPAIMDELG